MVAAHFPLSNADQFVLDALRRPATLERPPCRTLHLAAFACRSVSAATAAPRFLLCAHDAGALHPRPSVCLDDADLFASPAPPLRRRFPMWAPRTSIVLPHVRRLAEGALFRDHSSVWPPTDISGRHQPDGHPRGDSPTTRRYPASYWLRRVACADSALLSRRGCCPRSHDHTHTPQPAYAYGRASDRLACTLTLATCKLHMLDTRLGMPFDLDPWSCAWEGVRL